MQVINEKDPNAATLAGQFLKAGKSVVFATDTLYGIAVDASNDKAVEMMYRLKKRDAKKPIAIFVPDLKTAKTIFQFDDLAQKIAEEFLPGALTLVLQTKDESSEILSPKLNQNQDNFIGFRIVDSFFVQKIFQKYSGILAVSSANISGKDSLNIETEIASQLPEVDLLVVGESFSKIPSTVAKICDEKLTILRQGSLKLTQFNSNV